MRNLALFIGFCLYSISLCAQLPANLKYDHAQYESVPKLPDYDGTKAGDRPLVFSLKAYCPTPAYQGETGSCASFATAYSAYTIQRAIENEWTDTEQITREAYSAIYIHKQIVGEHCEEGSTLIDVAYHLKTKGDLKYNDFEGQGFSCINPNYTTDDLPSNYAIKDFAALFSYKNLHDPSRLQKIKKVLAIDKKPVIVGLDVPIEIAGLSPENFILKNTKDSPDLGGHGMVVVGYDEGRRAFELMNSWGTEWGNNGFFWMDFDDFNERLRYAIVLFLAPEGKEKNKTISFIDDPQEPKPIPQFPQDQAEILTAMKGNFTVKYRTEDVGLVFHDSPVYFSDTHYELLHTKWSVGQLFQLYTAPPQEGKYLYAFSVDNEGDTFVHWPRSKLYNNKFSEYNESAIISGEENKIIIPATNAALSIDKAGKDFLILLYADQEIPDFKERMEKINQDLANSLNVMTSLQKIFKDRLIPFQEINYVPNRMEFNTSSRNGDIVPIILIVNSE